MRKDSISTTKIHSDSDLPLFAPRQKPKLTVILPTKDDIECDLIHTVTEALRKSGRTDEALAFTRDVGLHPANWEGLVSMAEKFVVFKHKSY